MSLHDALPIVAADAPGRGGAGNGAGHVGRQAGRLGHVADGGARAVVDHRRGEAGAVAAVFRIDVLDHLLAALVLEIHVDVGRLVARGRDEALEQEAHPNRVDGRDVQAVADGGVGRRAPDLAEDAAAARERSEEHTYELQSLMRNSYDGSCLKKTKT